MLVKWLIEDNQCTGGLKGSALRDRHAYTVKVLWLEHTSLTMEKEIDVAPFWPKIH